MRLEILRIRLLRWPGYKGAEETVKLSLPMSAVFVGTFVTVLTQ